MLIEMMLEMIKPAMPILGLSAAIYGGHIYDRLKKHKFESLMRNCGLENKDKQIPLIIDKKSDKQKTVYILHLPAGLCMKDLENKKDELTEQLGESITIERAPSGKIALTAYKERLKTKYDFEHVQEINGKQLGPVEFALGRTHKGYLVVNLGGTDPHMAIGGATNSGKSVFLNALIVAAMLKPKNELVIDLIDLKRGVEFGIFEKSSRVEHYAKDPDSTFEVLANLTDIMHERLDLLAKYNIRNITDYNKRFRHKKMPYRLLVIDEFTLLKFIKGAHEMVEVLLCEARAVGIHIVTALQTHHAQNMPGTIKTNLGVVVAFKMRNEVHSRILLECGDAADLRGFGHGLVLAAGKLEEFQGFYIDDTMIKQLIGHTYVKKKPKEPDKIGVIPSGENKNRQKREPPF